MFSKLPQITFLIVFLFAASFAQTPTPTPINDDEPERIFAEEIKLNVSAYDLNGNFVGDVKKEDLVISEDGRLNQASSLRRIPANVLVVLDTGGEMRQVKRLKDTVKAAKNLIVALQPDDSVAIMDYHDKVEIVAEWTNKDEALKLLDSKANFGRRSVFINALEAATKFLQKTPRDNRHLVLITDGTDTFNNLSERRAATQNLLATDINVHVISYTRLEKAAIEPRTKGISKTPPRQAMPPEIKATLPNGVRDVALTPKSITISTDRAFLRKMKERKNALIESEKYLIALSKDTNGYLILPESRDEMLEKSASIAGIIDSSYVLTYVPKRALSESPTGEIRSIEVTSRRPNLRVQANRKLVVNGK
ncbi:MAG: VWA domain-containing protein [Pyrinomonadaceae bacterium]|nr:VWA domain-containing protein [Pyrinomonadaceae bacterium]